jgi:hypothetical protein
MGLAGNITCQNQTGVYRVDSHYRLLTARPQAAISPAYIFKKDMPVIITKSYRFRNQGVLVYSSAFRGGV